ncbi:MAG: glycogen debranching protein GlgX [Spirochaetales bacterium]|jgi:glycogen operon protein|nr:glycogen debranching protein GlgX [Spirochaetales bacterium]
MKTEAGRPLPLGATIHERGIQFAVFSRNATAVSLLLFDGPEGRIPVEEIVFDPVSDRSGDIWHIFVPDLKPGALYLYRVDGPYNPDRGHRFNRNKVLLDPYAKALAGNFRWRMNRAVGWDLSSPQRDLSFNTEFDPSGIPKCIVVGDEFDWQGDRPLNYPLRKSVIYETHVRSLSQDESSSVGHPGSYLGVVEKIPYLKQLGITSLELLPMMEFDEFEFERINPMTGKLLQNYWGYSTIAFFAPKGSYSSGPGLGEQVTEFKTMIRELHKAGIEVIMDVVFNHTGEGNELGPTYSFRGFDNSIYYILDENRRYYKNYSGCGNTLNCNHPLVRNMIIDSLHYWVLEMHVDGFRFDLGSILGRDQKGNLMENPPMLETIAEDPVLRHTKIIAEAWDAAGAYQVGWFPGGRWAEWNDRFRDDVRRFWRGDDIGVGCLATRITGSADLYLRDGRKPFHSINFVTSHDGFTLNDLVSYTVKHNEINGEANRDGSDNNLSSNYGFEGDVAAGTPIDEIRKRQVKNFMATLLLSLGTPMFLGGDEFRRTQKGNNNAYCQNSRISWFDWNLVKENQEIRDFFSRLVRFRLSHPVLLRPEFFTGKDERFNAMPDVSWFDEKGKTPDWEKQKKLLALCIDGHEASMEADRDFNDLFMMFNAGPDDRVFMVAPPRKGLAWHRLIDTGMAFPEDFMEEETAPLLHPQNRYYVTRQSFVLLMAK